MKQTVSFADFCDAFRSLDRADQFTPKGLRILFDYLEELEADSGEEIELDVIAICCDFNEDAPAEIVQNYGIELEDPEDEAEALEAAREYLKDTCAYVGETCAPTIVYRTF